MNPPIDPRELGAGDLRYLVRDLQKATDEVIAVHVGDQDFREAAFAGALRLIRGVRLALEGAIPEPKEGSVES